MACIIAWAILHVIRERHIGHMDLYDMPYGNFQILWPLQYSHLFYTVPYSRPWYRASYRYTCQSWTSTERSIRPVRYCTGHSLSAVSVQYGTARDIHWVQFPCSMVLHGTFIECSIRGVWYCTGHSRSAVPVQYGTGVELQKVEYFFQLGHSLNIHFAQYQWMSVLKKYCGFWSSGAVITAPELHFSQ